MRVRSSVVNVYGQTLESYTHEVDELKPGYMIVTAFSVGHERARAIFEVLDDRPDRCTCPMSVRETGQHSVGCPLHRETQ